MNLLFIYGPPAAGKLTVANEIAKLRDYKVFQNHQLAGSVSSVFSYDCPELKTVRNKLSRKFRKEIFVEAAKNNVDVITTFGGSSKNKFTFFNEVLDSVVAAGGNVFFVQLKPSQEAILERVESDSRRGVKIADKSFLLAKIKGENSYFDKMDGLEHLTIDNSELTAKETAEKIINYYGL